MPIAQNTCLVVGRQRPDSFFSTDLLFRPGFFRSTRVLLIPHVLAAIIATNDESTMNQEPESLCSTTRCRV
jgi:hypothetical protein